MAIFFDDRDRRVVPNWRTFKKTALLGELDSTNKEPKKSNFVLSIDDYLKDWHTNKTIPIAADLLSASLVNNIKEKPEIIEAANLILSNPQVATSSQQSLAHSLINKATETKLFNKIESITASDLQVLINPLPLRKKIQILKRNLSYFSANPITYVELSRLYSILGQEEQAKKAMRLAIHFGSQNRFVLRSAARLFAHYDDYDYAHDILRKSPLVQIDPWITSAEIALSTIRDRNSKFIKKGIEMIKSRNFSDFSLTELASSLGTVELLNGTLKKSREFFNSSLIDPNDNSLAQAEWATNKDKSLNIKLDKLQVEHSFEASAIDNFYSDDFEAALNDTTRWLVDMPFSKRPVLFGAHIAGALLDDHEKAITFTKAGLASHPNDPTLINNIVYSLILVGRLDEADSYMKQLPTNNEIDESTDICLTATSGLYYFRTGHPDKGRILYRKAIEDAKKFDSRYFNWLAILNYAREEILAKSEYIDEVMDIVVRIPENVEGNDVDKLKGEVIKLYKKSKQ